MDQSLQSAGLVTGRRRVVEGALWVLALAAGLAVAGVVSHFPGSSQTGSGIDRFQPEALLVGAVHGVLSAVFVALAVAIVMRPGKSVVLGVFLAMAFGIGASHALSDGLPASVPQPLVAAAGALSLTLGAYLFIGLRRPTALAAWAGSWVAGWLLGYAVAGQLGLSGGSTWTLEHLVVGVVMALVFGSATAAVGALPGAKDSAGP